MKYSIKNINSLNIYNNTSTFFGPDQAWYPKFWQRQAGCGPTSASLLTAYMRNLKDCKSIYPYDEPQLTQSNFIHHMIDLYRYITPTIGGVNHVDHFTKGLDKFLESRKIPLQCCIFNLDDYPLKDRTSTFNELVFFLQSGFDADSPIAFLNQSRGDETAIQNWHWVTLYEVDIDVSRQEIIAKASDEGESITFNLGLWYLTTTRHGGLIYLKEKN